MNVQIVTEPDYLLKMIDTKEAKAISLNLNISDINALKLIRRFIFDKKNIDVGVINRPTDLFQLQLMEIAVLKSAEFYGGLDVKEE